MPAERRRARARSAAAVAAAGAVLIGAFVWAMWPDDRLPSLPNEAPSRATHGASDAIDAVDAVAHDEAGAAPAAPAQRNEVGVRTAVAARVLDSAGAPLPDFFVTLQRLGRPPATLGKQLLEPSSVPSTYPVLARAGDDAGVAAFEDLEPAEYTCHLSDDDRVAETFTLAAGEVREVTLRCERTAVFMRLLRNGEIANDCFVRLVGHRAVPFPDAAGDIRTLVDPGRYEVFVHHRSSVVRGSWYTAWLNRYVLEVPSGAATHRRQFEVGGVDVVVRVADSAGVPVGSFAVDIEGTAAHSGSAVSYGLPGKYGVATMSMLPAGEWTVMPSGEFLVVRAQTLTAGDTGARMELTFTVARAALVVVKLNVGRRRAVVSPSMMPPLRCGDTEVPCGTEGRDGDLCYRALPGPVEMRCEDRVIDGELVPWPFDPVDPVSLVAVADSRHEITLDVLPRANVDLRACDGAGREWPGATLQVFAGDRRVRQQPGPVRDAFTGALVSGSRSPQATQRWSGPLAPGDYRVVIDRSGVRSEHTLRVDREPVEMRYRP